MEAIAAEAKAKKKTERTEAVTKHEAMINTLSGKPGFEAAKLAVEQATSNGVARKRGNEAVEERRDKRRNIKEREEILESALVKQKENSSETLTVIKDIAIAMQNPNSGMFSRILLCDLILYRREI